MFKKKKPTITNTKANPSGLIPRLTAPENLPLLSLTSRMDVKRGLDAK
jgi:hypothetical protein